MIRQSLYVVDTRNCQIQVMGKDGSFIKKWGSRGEKDGEFKHPHGIACSCTGGKKRIFVTDTENDRIQVFRPNGIVRKWRKNGHKGDYKSGGSRQWK